MNLTHQLNMYHCKQEQLCVAECFVNQVLSFTLKFLSPRMLDSTQKTSR